MPSHRKMLLGAVCALAAAGAADLSVHHGRLEATVFGDLICFAGLGPGEVCADGRKLVGLAQRRTREGVRFHTVCPVDPVGDVRRLGEDEGVHR